jgi:2-dehydropantoate 2-reductase
LRFAVIGAGAAGGYLGARLQQSGEDVSFLVRPGRKKELDQVGLVVRSPLGDLDLRVKAETEAEKIGDCDVILVAVKNYGLDSVLDSIRLLGRNGARVVSILNGIEHLERICSVVDKNRIVGSPLYIEVEMGPEGRILHRSVTPALVFGSLVGSPETATPVADAFAKAGVKASVSADLLGKFWRKNVFITVFSGVTSLARSPIGRILEDGRSAALVEDMVDECVEIARLAEPGLGNMRAEEVMKLMRTRPAEMTSSMHRDMEKGLPIEVESLQGYMVRKADALGVSAPVLRTCYGSLRLLDRARFRTS